MLSQWNLLKIREELEIMAMSKHHEGLLGYEGFYEDSTHIFIVHEFTRAISLQDYYSTKREGIDHKVIRVMGV